MFYFDDPLQFVSQVYSDASSEENPGCESSSRQGMEEAADNSSIATGESQEQEGSYSRSTERHKKKIHFATLMDICHLQNAELEAKLQKYKGRVVLRGDIVKDDSGSYAVFTEQGSSASQMTAAKVMDVIARLPDCDGQAADAVSAHTQVKFEDAPKIAQNS